MEELLIPNGVVVDGQVYKKAPLAETTGEAEMIFTSRPSETKMYSWFGEVISAAIANIGGNPIASEFFKKKGKDRVIPKAIKDLDFTDAGSLVLQVHRECWEDIIEEQHISCRNCGHSFKTDVDLNKIKVPFDEKQEKLKEVKVVLKKDYTVPDIELFDEIKGTPYNTLTFRVIKLGDAIRNEGLGKKEVEFWRRLCFDTLDKISYTDRETEEEIELPSKFKTGRGMVLFNKDLNSKELKHIRKSVQTATPSAKLFYEDECPSCKKDTPFFANVNAFFLA